LLESLPKGRDAPERIKALLSEDPVVARKRSFLEDRKVRLMEIKERLDDFHKAVDRMLIH